MQNNKITQENDSHLITIISYLQVVDDGDGVAPPIENHGAHPAPGSVLRIELQDVVVVVVIAVVAVAIVVAVSGAPCIVLYYYTNCIGDNNNADHEQSPVQGVTVCTCYHHFIVQCGATQILPG